MQVHEFKVPHKTFQPIALCKALLNCLWFIYLKFIDRAKTSFLDESDKFLVCDQIFSYFETYNKYMQQEIRLFLGFLITLIITNVPDLYTVPSAIIFSEY